MSTNAAASEKVTLDLQDLYENAPCGYHSVGPDETILRMNRTELTWLGYARQELIGKRKLAELVSGRFRSEYKNAIQALIGGRDISEIEIELVRKDGSMFDAFLRIAAVRDSQGIFLYTRTTVIDITVRKRAEVEARIHADQLQAISQRVVEIQETERRNLSAELHDRLGQDLAAINLNLHLVKDQLSAGSRTKVGPRLDDSIALVAYGRGRARRGRRAASVGARRLRARGHASIVRRAVCGAQRHPRECRGEAAGATAAAGRRDGLVSDWPGGADQCTEARQGRHGAMTLAAEAQSVSLTIADDGCGFDAQSALYHRTHGLGLLIMQERLRAVDGSLRIESQPGAGTSVVAKVRRGR
jgi:PAS domain S-box